MQLAPKPSEHLQTLLHTLNSILAAGTHIPAQSQAGPRPSVPKATPHKYQDLEQYMSESQILQGLTAWVHAKGEIMARIGQASYLRNKASSQCSSPNQSMQLA